MPSKLPFYDTSDRTGVRDRVLSELDVMLESKAPVDIITFSESPDYLNGTLYPRQRLILKIYYRLPLTSYPCWCQQQTARPGDEEPPIPTSRCHMCRGTGVYDELLDRQYLLSGVNKYARMFFPNLCEHHVNGTCSRKACHQKDLKKDYRILSLGELAARLRNHGAYLLEVIGGRRGSKSVLGSYVGAYSLYLLLRHTNPQAFWGVQPGQKMGITNVATDEKQALILFDQLKELIDRSPWFKRVRSRLLETLVEFPSRHIFAESKTSNSASVRGNTLISIFLDEFCHFNHTSGKQSDEAMRKAIEPSVLTFGKHRRIVVPSSPVNKAGTAYDWYDHAESQTHDYINLLVFQLATWEMNPTIDRDTSPLIAGAYASDADYAEMEYGAQWAESVGQFLPPESVEACVNPNRSRNTHGSPGIKYAIHVDLSKKRDSCGLVVTHYDKTLGKVVADRIEEFNPDDTDNEWMTDNGTEIDHQKVLDYIIKLHEVYKFRFNSITFDQFNSAWLLQALRKHFRDQDGKWIIELNINEKTNREIFSNLRSLITQGGIELYRHHELLSQLILLSKTIKPSGNWKIEAPPGHKDDIADALGARALMCLIYATNIETSIIVIKETEDDKERTSPKLSSPFTSIKHLPGCTTRACAWGCPVLRKQKEVELGVEHSPECTKTFCVARCPYQRALLAR